MKPINEARMRAFEAIIPTLRDDLSDDERERRAVCLAIGAARDMMTEEDYGGPLAGCRDSEKE